jgi:hypothetical protein
MMNCNVKAVFGSTFYNQTEMDSIMRFLVPTVCWRRFLCSGPVLPTCCLWRHAWNDFSHPKFHPPMKPFICQQKLKPFCQLQWGVTEITRYLTFIPIEDIIIIIIYLSCIYISVQRDATIRSIYSLFHCKITLIVSGAIYTHHQEYRKL